MESEKEIKNLRKELRKYELGSVFCSNQEDLEIRLKNLGILDFFNELDNKSKMEIVYMSGVKRYPKLSINSYASEKIRLMSRILSMYNFFSKIDPTNAIISFEKAEKEIPESFFTFNLIEIMNECGKNGIKIKSDKVIETIHKIYSLLKFRSEIKTVELREVGSADHRSVEEFEINQTELLECKKNILDNINNLKSYLIQCYNLLLEDQKVAQTQKSAEIEEPEKDVVAEVLIEKKKMLERSR